MARAKQGSKRKLQRKALPIFGAAGASLAMGGAASAAAVPIENVPSKASPYNIVVLDEDEISDVSLATFYVLDRERLLGEKVAQRGGCRGCGGGGRCAAARCGGGKCAVARCGGGRCAAARCARCAAGRCGGCAVARCAGCGCTCSGCTGSCWASTITGWVYVC